LDFSGRSNPAKIPVDIKTLVQETTSLLPENIEGKIDVSFRDTTGILPTIHVDAGQIQQVVLNLLINAAEAGDGRVRLTISLVHANRKILAKAYLDDSLPEGDYMSITVIDQGPGMNAKTLARIFDPFYTTKPKGRGLGLAVVMGVIRAHQGAIRVTSKPKKGTQFELLLPIQKTTQNQKDLSSKTKDANRIKEISGLQ
jgi:signal transduction histidine kinase